MLQQIKSVAFRAQGTLLQDAVGAAALIVLLMVGLHLPGFM